LAEPIEATARLTLADLTEGAPTLATLPLSRTVGGELEGVGMLIVEYIYYKSKRPEVKSHPTWVGKVCMGTSMLPFCR
jgi:hypothetical protein